MPDFLKQKLAVVKGDGSDHEMDKEDDDKQDGDKPHMQHQHETKGLNLELLEAAQKFTGALVASPMRTTRSAKGKNRRCEIEEDANEKERSEAKGLGEGEGNANSADNGFLLIITNNALLKDLL